MFNKSPAKRQLGLLSDSNPYAITQQEGLLLTVYSRVPIVRSQLFLINDTVLAYALNSTTLLLESFVEAKTIKLYSTISGKVSGYYVKPNTPVGSLSVQCYGLKLNQVGYLGWSVCDSNGILLLSGNDSQALGLCSYSSTYNWLPGKYKLEVREFSKETGQAVAYSYRWYQLPNLSSIIEDLSPGVVLV